MRFIFGCVKLCFWVIRTYFVAILFCPCLKSVWDNWDRAAFRGVFSLQTLLDIPKNILFYASLAQEEPFRFLVFLPTFLIFIYYFAKLNYQARRGEGYRRSALTD